MMMSYRVRSIVIIVLFISVIAVNYLANAIPINGLTQRQISAQFSILLTPAGYVFSIWGLIYLGLATYTIAQALPQYRNRPKLRALDLPFALSCICNMLWLIVWHYQYIGLSVVLMLGLLGSLVWSYIRIDRGDRTDKVTPWFVGHTFSIYLGWVCLATVLNLSIWLHTHGWEGTPFDPQVWAVILLAVVCILFLYIALTRHDATIMGVLSWAGIGISIKQQTEMMVVIAGYIACAFGIAMMIWLSLSKRRLNV